MRSMLETSVFVQHISHVRRGVQLDIDQRRGLFSAPAMRPRRPISETLMRRIASLGTAPHQKMRRGERPSEIKNICLKGIGEPNGPLSAHG